MISLYVIRSTVNGRRYVGITAGLGTRLRTHAGKSTKGGQLLQNFELIHTEQFPSYAAARVREKFLKSGQGRAWLDTHFGRRADAAIDTASP